jgi:hypothetical protein
VQKVIIVGPGAAGKTTLALRLGEITGLPVIELDKHFWRWLLTYRRRSRPLLLQAIAAHAGDTDVPILPTPRTVRRFLAQAGRGLSAMGMSSRVTIWPGRDGHAANAHAACPPARRERDFPSRR